MLLSLGWQKGFMIWDFNMIDAQLQFNVIQASLTTS